MINMNINKTLEKENRNNIFVLVVLIIFGITSRLPFHSGQEAEERFSGERLKDPGTVAGRDGGRRHRKGPACSR